VGKRQPAILPLAILPIIAGGIGITCPVKKKAKHANTGSPSSSTMATASVPHLPIKPKSDWIGGSPIVRHEEQQPEVQKDEEELEALFDKISNYSVFDFLPFASFGRQGCVEITNIALHIGFLHVLGHHQNFTLPGAKIP
jgi:hypothetical protein